MLIDVFYCIYRHTCIVVMHVCWYMYFRLQHILILLNLIKGYKMISCHGSRSGKNLVYCTILSIHLNVWVMSKLIFFCILFPFLGERNLIQIMVSLWNIDRWVTVSADIEMLPIYKHVFCTIHRRKLTTYKHDVLLLLSYNRHILWLKMYIV